MKPLKFIAANWPALIIAVIFIAWFFFVGELFGRHCPRIPPGAVDPLYCDIFFWWRWFD